MQLRGAGGGEVDLCWECGERQPAGPCAVCRHMICVDCGVLAKDASGTRCVCRSCAALAVVGDRRLGARRRRAPLVFAIAVLALIAFGLAVLRGAF